LIPYRPGLGLDLQLPLLSGDPLSCLFTKQHYLIDLPAGAGLGALMFWISTVVI
jgi:hypothetical protein